MTRGKKHEDVGRIEASTPPPMLEHDPRSTAQRVLDVITQAQDEGVPAQAPKTFQLLHELLNDLR